MQKDQITASLFTVATPNLAKPSNAFKSISR